MEGSLIVAIEVHGLRMRNLQILEEDSESSKFTSSRCHGTIFSFNREVGDSSRLFLGVPRDRACAKLDK